MPPGTQHYLELSFGGIFLQQMMRLRPVIISRARKMVTDMKQRHIRRLLIGLFLCIPLLTTAAFPGIDAQIGPAVLFDRSVASPDVPFTSEDFSFGIDGRFAAGFVSANILSYVCREACSEDGEGLRINTYVKAGAALDIALLRLGAYIGP